MGKVLRLKARRRRGELAAAQFSEWLYEVHEDTSQMTASRVFNLYVEAADFFFMAPMSEARFFRDVGVVVLERYRLGTGAREWRYRLALQDTERDGRARA